MKPNFSFEIHGRMRGGFLFVEMQDCIIMDGNNKSSYKQYDLLPFHCSAQSKSCIRGDEEVIKTSITFSGKEVSLEPTHPPQAYNIARGPTSWNCEC